ncbi:hypothetical protein L6452_06386 [Arctium lappa]|uniref:Uncharacterized protein n=1 Tax=Arctium lappa TaxID=4217 RepID=A0ACB9EIK2_ARCLA|nr:hypothetical protein L6452_06386 [Arctium lappa]
MVGGCSSMNVIEEVLRAPIDEEVVDNCQAYVARSHQFPGMTYGEPPEPSIFTALYRRASCSRGGLQQQNRIQKGYSDAQVNRCRRGRIVEEEKEKLEEIEVKEKENGRLVGLNNKAILHKPYVLFSV